MRQTEHGGSYRTAIPERHGGGQDLDGRSELCWVHHSRNDPSAGGWGSGRPPIGGVCAIALSFAPFRYFVGLFTVSCSGGLCDPSRLSATLLRGNCGICVVHTVPQTLVLYAIAAYGSKNGTNWLIFVIRWRGRE